MTPASFGPYRLTGELGRGAMGAVYRAVDPDGRAVALKVVSTEAFPSALGRLRREGDLAARLEHPGIVRVLDAGEVDGRPYVAYQLVEGARTLADLLARSPPPLEQTLEMLRDVAAALGHAHARGIVHRDVKPQNILIGADGRPVVADLGISIGQGVERLTVTGQVFGTPSYMAPEQMLGQPTTPATDVWSLGVTLYAALTRQLPYAAASFDELCRATARPPVPPRKVAPTIPPAVEAVILKALSADPADRYDDGAQLAAALDEAMGETATVSRSRRVILLALLLVAAGLVVILVLVAGAGAPPPPAAPPPATGPTPPAPPPVTEASAPAWIAGSGAPWPLPAGLVVGPAPGQVVNVKDGSVLAWIPPGRVRLEEDDDVPGCMIWDLDVAGCFVGVREVTFGQFRRFCREAGRPPPDPRIEGLAGGFTASDDHPVFHVTWYDAVAYCAWAGLRLPREAEWERAARGDDPARRFPWGAELPRTGPPVANVSDRSLVGLVPETWGGIDADYDDGHVFPAPVGSFPAGASQFGCLDLAGNVWEWTADGWGDLPPPPQPAELASERVTRGGSWDNSSPWCRSTNRGHLRASSKVNYLGLRVAR